MKPGARARLALVACGCAAVVACAAARPRAGHAIAASHFTVRGDGGVRPFGEFVVGGATDPTIPFLGDAGPRVAIASDAGVASAESAWLVAHIDNGPNRLHPLDSGSVQALTARGADGVHGVVPILRAGDATRAPFARRVIERLLLRACGHAGHARAVDVGAWIERGYEPERAAHESDVFLWTRTDSSPWPAPALERLEGWASSGMHCEVPASDQAVVITERDAGRVHTASAASAEADAASDATPGFDATITMP